MDAIDILGGLLRKRSGSSGLGGQILKNILTGSRSSAPAPGSQTIPQRPAGAPVIRDAPTPTSTHRTPRDEQLDHFEDMLRQAHGRGEQQNRSGQRDPAPGTSRYGEAEQSSRLSDKSELIVRAMINAAKADGRIDQAEQDAIVRQLGNPTQADIEFLRREFAAPLDIREFVWSIPLGMENEIYAISLMAVNLDSSAEERYLIDLAHGLRILPAVRDQIHQRFGVTSLP
ncbi:MAG: DUF533 domain-containing protein [Planctomycetaceae bacterium]|nr:DUF533 domain-containing protein [Planctomycetaceae bacterium]